MASQTQQKLNSLKIGLLKNIKELEIDFEGSELTAIMGVNGCGKSTILHALACCYKPLEDEERYDWKFSEFFTPNTDALWQGSNFSMFHDYRMRSVENQNVEVGYSKQADRWSPRYSQRPQRHVSFIGIESCVPVIEREKMKTMISYLTTPINSPIADLVREKAGVVMNRDYTSFNQHTTKRTSYIGVSNQGFSYSALSMGAGEQRIFHILTEVFKAPKYSLILIDEIDLLLHVDALKRLLKILRDRARDKNLQIIFTTHSLIVLEMEGMVNIRYIYQTPAKTLCLNETKPDIIYYLTGESYRPLSIYVEDDLAKAIVKRKCEEFGMTKYVNVRQFGAAKNAFTLVSGMLLEGKDIENSLFVIDGDVYRSEEEKRGQINDVLTGDTARYQQLRGQALYKITQFDLEDGYNPERYICTLIKQLEEDNLNEVKTAALEIVNVDNAHKYVDDIITRLGEERSSGLRRVIELASKSPKWRTYTQSIENWLIDKALLVKQPQQENENRQNVI